MLTDKIFQISKSVNMKVPVNMMLDKTTMIVHFTCQLDDLFLTKWAVLGISWDSQYHETDSQEMREIL